MSQHTPTTVSNSVKDHLCRLKLFVRLPNGSPWKILVDDPKGESENAPSARWDCAPRGVTLNDPCQVAKMLEEVREEKKCQKRQTSMSACGSSACTPVIKHVDTNQTFQQSKELMLTFRGDHQTQQRSWSKLLRLFLCLVYLCAQ